MTRRRGAELEQAICRAVLLELAERGYAATTYEGVAARAGTSKPVLYRRWASKAEMVLAAKTADLKAVVPEASGDLGQDLKALLRTMSAYVDDVGRGTLLNLLAELDPDSTEALRRLMFSRGLEILDPVLTAARRRGDLGPEPIPRSILALPFDLVRHHIVVMGALSQSSLDEIVDLIAVPLLKLWSTTAETPGRPVED